MGRRPVHVQDSTFRFLNINCSLLASECAKFIFHEAVVCTFVLMSSDCYAVVNVSANLIPLILI